MPSERTVNLYFKERKVLRPGMLLCLPVLLLAAGLFGKFAVADRFARLSEARKALESERAALEELTAGCADYDEIREKYEKYTYQGFDRSTVNRVDILGMLERVVFPKAGVQRLAVSGNTVSMTLTGLTLEQISDLLNELEADPLVDRVTVSTTGYGKVDEGPDAVPLTNMTVELVPAGTEGGRE